MQRYVFLAGIFALFCLALLPRTPAFAITAKQKMVTCKFGADDEKLTGKARADFLKKCMSNRNDPRGPAVGSPQGEGAPKG